MTDYTIHVPVDEVLEKLDHGRNWTQGAWEDQGKICLHQGIRMCQYQPGDAYLIEQVADQCHWGTGFNDEGNTTFDHIKQKLVEHREILPQELFNVYGPQWRQVIDLVRGIDAEDHDISSSAVADVAAANAADVISLCDMKFDQSTGVAVQGLQLSAGILRMAPDGCFAGADAARAVAGYHLIGRFFTQSDYDVLVRFWVADHGSFDYTITGPPTPEENGG